MYIALEGIKGSGKSSVFETLLASMSADGRTFQTLRPTLSIPGSRIVEPLFRWTGARWPNLAIELLYAWRSNHHASSIARIPALVIGERSLLTSYVTRWDDAAPRRAVARADLLHWRIPLPDHVVYFDIPIETAIARIRARKARHYGRKDETPERLRVAQRGYEYLAQYGAEVGLPEICWHRIDATRPLAEVIDAASDVVRCLTGSKGDMRAYRAAQP